MGFAVLLCLMLAFSRGAFAITYLSADDFVADSFDTAPAPAVVWLTPAYQDVAKEILGHAYRGLRLRYWRDAGKTAWIMEEIGKERPITIGIVIEGDTVSRVDILAYREPRGDEVRHPFFTRQFMGLGLTSELDLSGQIDGITGATLSVRAVTNVSRFALYLHREVTGG